MVATPAVPIHQPLVSDIFDLFIRFSFTAVIPVDELVPPSSAYFRFPTTSQMTDDVDSVLLLERAG